MPTMRPASMTSRKTIRRLASTRLLRDDDALRRVGMIFTHERIAPRRERTDAHIAAGIAGDDLLDLQRGGIELLRRRIVVRHDDDIDDVRLDVDFGRREAVVLELERDRRVVRQRGGREQERAEDQESKLHGGFSRLTVRISYASRDLFSSTTISYGPDPPLSSFDRLRMSMGCL